MKERKSRIAEFIETIGEGSIERSVLLGGLSFITHASKNGGNCTNGDHDTCNESKNRGTCYNAVGTCKQSKNGCNCKDYDPKKKS